jgi:hypothetical protein
MAQGTEDSVQIRGPPLHFVLTGYFPYSQYLLAPTNLKSGGPEIFACFSLHV